MKIRNFQPEDAVPLSKLIAEALFLVNAKDYPKEELKRLAATYSAQELLRLSAQRTVLVAHESNVLLGTAAFEQSRDDPDNSRGEKNAVSVFVAPLAQGSGVGRALMRELECRAKNQGGNIIFLEASITAAGFYEALGYSYRGGKNLLPDGCYPMEKILR